MKKLNQAIAIGALFSLIFGWTINISLVKTSAANSAQDKSYENVSINVITSDDVSLSKEEIQELVAEEFTKHGIEVVAEGSDKTLAVTVSLQRKDGDLDDDGVPDTQDADDDGNGTPDADEQVTPITAKDLGEEEEKTEEEPEETPTPTPTPAVFQRVSLTPKKAVPSRQSQIGTPNFSLKMQSEVSSFMADINSGKLTDPVVIEAKREELRKKYADEIKQAEAQAGLDVEQLKKELTVKLQTDMKELVKKAEIVPEKLKNEALKVLETGFNKTNQENQWLSKFDRRGVKIFEGVNSSGKSAIFGIGTFWANHGSLNGIGNDTASSIEVPTGFRVRICSTEGQNREGAENCEEYTEGSHNLRYSKQASWVRVTKGGGDFTAAGVTIYEGEFGGRSSVFGMGVFTADNGPLNGIGNDAASSVQVPRGFRVKLCSDEGRNREGAGQCEEYGEGRHSLRYKRTASWVQVIQLEN